MRNQFGKALAIAACAAILSAATEPAARAATITDDNVGAMVNAATTAADHQALAEYFRAAAKDADKLAQKHQSMLLSQPGKGSSVWDAHCRRLIKRYDELAADYRTMASEQDGMAKAVAAQPH